MFGVLKEFLGLETPQFARRTEFLNLASELERYVDADFPSKTGGRVVDVAKRIRSVLRRGVVSELDTQERVRVLKMLNRAKVRALVSTKDDSGYEIFRSLDSITSDVASII
ncbi:MAG: hypothetical protein AABW86_01855 [Candidatus Micrarchaeota archaeon]